MKTGVKDILLKAPPTDETRKLTDKQLSDFANFSGSGGSGDSLTNLNKRLLNKGFRDNNYNYGTSMATPITSDGFELNKSANTIIPAMAMSALAKAKKMGIKNVMEFLVNKDTIIDNPVHNKMINDPQFKRMYPNALQTIAQLYVDRNNEYKPSE